MPEPQALAALQRQRSGVNLFFLPLNTRDPRSLLEQGQADLAMGFFPAVAAAVSAEGHSAPVRLAPLYDSDYVCVMRRGHPLAEPGALTLDAYCAARHLLVSFSGRPFGFVDEALSAMSRQRRVVITVNQFFTAGRVVASTDLLPVLPRHFVGVTGFADQLVMRELPFQVAPIQIDALWHPRHHGSSAHAWLRQLVVEQARRSFLC